MGKTMIWHLLAAATVVFWGSSFASTKALLNHGFTAVQIFALRFAATWLVLLAAGRSRPRLLAAKDELALCLCGLCGCTLYYWAENSALAVAKMTGSSMTRSAPPFRATFVRTYLSTIAGSL